QRLRWLLLVEDSRASAIGIISVIAMAGLDGLAALRFTGDVQHRVWTSQVEGAAPMSPSAADPTDGKYQTLCERWHKGSSDANAGLQGPCTPGSAMERATGIEPATSSLGSWHSAAELRPRLPRTLVSRPALCQWSALPQNLGYRGAGVNGRSTAASYDG